MGISNYMAKEFQELVIPEQRIAVMLLLCFIAVQNGSMNVGQKWKGRILWCQQMAGVAADHCWCKRVHHLPALLKAHQGFVYQIGMRMTEFPAF